MDMQLTGDEYAEVMTLYSTYNHSSDTGDPAHFAACFTEDGAMKINGKEVRAGRANHESFKRDEQAGRRGRHRRHWCGSIELRKVAEATIHGRCYLRVFESSPGEEPKLSVAGVYEDVVVRVKDGWRFQVRDLAFDFQR